MESRFQLLSRLAQAWRHHVSRVDWWRDDRVTSWHESCIFKPFIFQSCIFQCSNFGFSIFHLHFDAAFWFYTVAYWRGHWAMASKDFLAPKYRTKSRLTGYYCYLILRKVTKFVATRCPILRLKCTKFNFGWDTAPDPAGGAYSVPPTS